MALQRKKVTVRTKRGKTYQRSMMVQAQAIGRRASKSGKLHALNPWEQRHTEHVSTNSALGERAKMYGSSGPGSDHSAFALAVGARRGLISWSEQRGLSERAVGGHNHAIARARSAMRASEEVGWQQRANGASPSWLINATHGAERTPAAERITELSTAFGVPKSHVRRNYQGARFPSNW